MQAVILAGGKGRRLGKLSQKLPKSLIKIGDKPLIEHQILLLKRYNINNIWILTGYLSEQIERFCGNGKKWGVQIHHLIEESPLGTAGALKALENKINKDFMVISGDVMFDIDIKRFISFHRKNKKAWATIIVHPNDHPFDSDLVEVDDKDQVTSFLIRKGKTQPKNLLFRNLTIASAFIFCPKIFGYIGKNERSDLEKDIFPRILKSGGKLYACKTSEYIKDIGTPERLRKTRSDYRSGTISRLNKKNIRRAIFLDRDGVINDNVHNFKKIDDFKLFSFSPKAIRKINDREYLAIVITNQPAIAKGLLTLEELDLIHKKLETELGWSGAKLDAIYYCPHHPERGFEGEVPQLKISCNCRKPKTGLIKKAVSDFNINLKKSFLIGDSTLDAKTAEEAGVKFIGVRTGYGVSDKKYKVRNFKMAKNLFSAVNYILN